MSKEAIILKNLKKGKYKLHLQALYFPKEIEIDELETKRLNRNLEAVQEDHAAIKDKVKELELTNKMKEECAEICIKEINKL